MRSLDQGEKKKVGVPELLVHDLLLAPAALQDLNPGPHVGSSSLVLCSVRFDLLFSSLLQSGLFTARVSIDPRRRARHAERRICPTV